MNATKLIAAFAIFATTGSVFAQEYVQPDARFSSSKSRSEVIAEVNQARQNGTLQSADVAYPAIDLASTQSRSDVLAKVVQAREAGTLHVADYQYPLAQFSGEGKTREQIRAELSDAIANNTMERSVN